MIKLIRKGSISDRQVALEADTKTVSNMACDGDSVAQIDDLLQQASNYGRTFQVILE